MLDFENVKDDLQKDIAQPYTMPAMSLIKKTLDDAWEAGVKYDIRDMRPAIVSFAAGSYRRKDICMKMANELHLSGKNI